MSYGETDAAGRCVQRALRVAPAGADLETRPLGAQEGLFLVVARVPVVDGNDEPLEPASLVQSIHLRVASTALNSAST